ncbi:MAG: murein L,D-transpeptidase family protein [Pseudomonadota bacterium]
MSSLIAQSKRMLFSARRILLASAVLVPLAACQDGLDGAFPKAERPIPERLKGTMRAKGMGSRSPIMIRIFKEEDTLEVWKRKSTGRYDLLKSYEICKWSGKLGPKHKEGDRQAPEGFYHVTPALMNPNSSYYLSFNMGFPNSYDRSHGRTGSHLMIHGACSSAGCYSMTDELISEIYALAREAFRGGQRSFQIQAYPFRMTPENMVKHRDSKNYAFWEMLKEGYDHFEATKIPPRVEVCGKRYNFNVVARDGERFSARRSCPSLGMPESLALSYLDVKRKEADVFEKLLAKKEDRDRRELPPMTLATALPGIEVIKPEPKPVEPEIKDQKTEQPSDLVAQPKQQKPADPVAATLKPVPKDGPLPGVGTGGITVPTGVGPAGSLAVPKTRPSG